jgi:GT2 family glycosyltransferase
LYNDYNAKPYAVSFGSFNKPLLHNRNYIDIHCLLHKKQVFNEIGFFDENLSELMDWDYILRISNNFKMYSVPVILSKYYGHSPIYKLKGNCSNYYEISSEILQKNEILIKQYKNLSHKVSIIIPNYESLVELKLCIETILSFNLNDMVDIIVIDNNSGIEIKEYLKKLESDDTIKLKLNDVNYGFTYAVKQGIDLSEEDTDILILNNDAILTEGAIQHMQEGAYNYKNCGIIVPHEVVFEQNPHMIFHVPYADPNFKCDITPSKAHHNIIEMPVFHDGGLLELNFAPFFCTYIKREVYNKTLGLDPELGRHYRSDHIFSDFVRHILKLKIYQEPNAFVYHKHQTATIILSNNKQEYDLMFNKNQWPPELAEKLGYEKPLWD